MGVTSLPKLLKEGVESRSLEDILAEVDKGPHEEILIIVDGPHITFPLSKRKDAVQELTSEFKCKAPSLLESVKKKLEAFLIDPRVRVIFVADGRRFPPKANEHEKRLARVEKSRAKLKEFERIHLTTADAAAALRSDQQKEWFELKRDVAFLREDNYKDIYDMANSLEHVMVFQAPWEADSQLVYLQHAMNADFIAAIDSDVFAFGGDNILMPATHGKFILIKRDETFSRSFFKDFNTDDMKYLCCMLGSDFTEGVPGWGPKKARTVLEDCETANPKVVEEVVIKQIRSHCEKNLKYVKGFRLIRERNKLEKQQKKLDEKRKENEEDRRQLEQQGKTPKEKGLSLPACLKQAKAALLFYGVFLSPEVREDGVKLFEEVVQLKGREDLKIIHKSSSQDFVEAIWSSFKLFFKLLGNYPVFRVDFGEQIPSFKLMKDGAFTVHLGGHNKRMEDEGPVWWNRTITEYGLENTPENVAFCRQHSLDSELMTEFACARIAPKTLKEWEQLGEFVGPQLTLETTHKTPLRLLILFLEARGVGVTCKHSKDFSLVHKHVRRVLELEKRHGSTLFKAVDPSLRRIDAYTPVAVFKSRVDEVAWRDGNSAIEYILENMMELHQSEYVDKTFDYDGVRNRAHRLFKGGHVNANSMKICSMDLKQGEGSCTIVSVEVAASQRQSIYKCLICFDSEGRFMAPPYTSGMCVTSTVVCSHQIACLMLFAKVQFIKAKDVEHIVKNMPNLMYTFQNQYLLAKFVDAKVVSQVGRETGISKAKSTDNRGNDTRVQSTKEVVERTGPEITEAVMKQNRKETIQHKKLMQHWSQDERLQARNLLINTHTVMKAIKEMELAKMREQGGDEGEDEKLTFIDQTPMFQLLEKDSPYERYPYNYNLPS